MKKNIAYGKKYGPAMEITGQLAADDYFEKLVAHSLKWHKAEGKRIVRAEAEQIERSNLGYYAGYYDSATRARVERLFGCSHPVFGSIAKNDKPTEADALAAGMVAAKSGTKMARKLFKHAT